MTNAAWALTAEALAKLLEAFSPDQGEASRLYLATHLKLVRYFEWKTCRDPEHHVDVTFNRVARKLLEGEQIDNVVSYAWVVADLVRREVIKDQNRMSVDLPDCDVIATEPPSEDETHEARLKWLDECLEELVPESRALILEYHQRETKAKDARRNLAARLGIPLNALRIRAYRIRIELERCMERCMQAA